MLTAKEIKNFRDALWETAKIHQTRSNINRVKGFGQTIDFLTDLAEAEFQAPFRYGEGAKC